MVILAPESACAQTGPQFREYVRSVPPDARPEAVFARCMRPIIYSRHHWLKHDGDYQVRADLRKALEDLQERDPAEWDDTQSDFLLALFCLDRSAVGLDELDDRVDVAAVREVLEQRLGLYRTVVSPDDDADDQPRDLIALADQVRAARAATERTHLLYSIIDGKVWFRTEGVIPYSALDFDTLSEPVSRMLADDFENEPGPPGGERLRQATRVCLAAHGESAPLLRGIMRAALQDEVLRGDHVTLTCPQGDLLDTPELMTTSEAFFTETQLRDGLELGCYRERLGHESSDQVQRTIRARMLKLKRGAIRSLYGPGCMQGVFVEKHGGHMIFRNEDAHYRGHQSIGCSTGGRGSFAIRYQRDGQERELTRMVGDLRVVRMSHDEQDLFTGEELVHVIRYADWMRTVAEETFRNGCVIRRNDP